MVQEVSPQGLQDLVQGNTRFALIDVREPGEYNSSHIPGSSLIPRRILEFQMAQSVPAKSVHVVVCDDDGRRSALAAQTLETMGYTQVSVLAGGINWWVSQKQPTEWGSNVPSKDFGERMEVEHHVPEIEATELHQWIEEGKKMVILDTRTPEEYQRFNIPGGRSVPGGELALRITDITKDLDPDTTVVVNCAGRTRSIIGTRALQRMGLTNAVGLKNGTSGWVLAGYQLETGANRTELPQVSPQGLAAAEAYASRAASEDGVRFVNIEALQEKISRRSQDNVYLIDVRTQEEYNAGHIPGFTWFPGGQVVQRSDDVAVVKNAPIIFACDKYARSTLVASWYRQLGLEEVYAVDGGSQAWVAAGLELELGVQEPTVAGLADASAKVSLISPQELQEELQKSGDRATIHVDTSQEFSRGHIPGARWVPRGWLELQIGEAVPAKDTPVAVTCSQGQLSILAASTLSQMGYRNVSVLDGGMAAWLKAGLAVETGLSGITRPPTDLVYSGPDRNYADMMNYLRWETALGEKYQSAAD